MKRIFLYFAFLCFLQITVAQKEYEDSLKIALANAKQPIDRFSVLVKIGELNFITGDGNVDSPYCLTLNQIAQQLENDSLRAIAYNWIGDYFLLNKGDNVTALEYFFKGLPLAEKAGDKRRISSFYHDISVAYFNLDNRSEARENIIKMGANLPDKSSSMYNYMAMQYQASIANYYIQQKQPDSAIHFVQGLNELNLKEKNVIFESDAFSLSGRLYELLKETDLAELYYQKANHLIDSSHFYYMKYLNKKNYANFLIRIGKIQEARQQGYELLELGRQINNNNFKLAGAGFLRQVYDKMNMIDSAYIYSRLESLMRDSIFSQNNINKVQALAFNEQIRLTEKEAKNAAEAEQRKQNIQNVLIALGILIFIVVYLLLSRSFITNEKLIEFLGVLGLLIVFEFLNLLLHPFLERVTNRSPILMLLSLVCIAALLVPLHHRLEIWTTKKLVEKNKQIRLAAAKKTIQLLEKKESI